MEDGRKISRETLETYRFRALDLRKKRWRVNDIAESLGLHRGSVSRWLTKSKREGEEILKMKKAPGSRPKLEHKEIKNILSYLKDPATKYGFETPLWTCKRVQSLIKKKCKTSIHISNVWRMLVSWNFTPQVPKPQAWEQNPKKVQEWLENEWPKIKEHYRRWKAIVYFQDESSVSLIPVLGRTWAPKGQTPIIRVTGRRGSFCVTSAISPAGHLIFRIEKKTVTAKEHKDFLQQILNQHPTRKIIVVEDKARPHIANMIKEFIIQNKNRFAIYYLPSYSPQLNPDETTWKYLKQHKLAAHQAQSTDELKKIVFSKMKSIQKQPNLVKSFFNGTFVT